LSTKIGLKRMLWTFSLLNKGREPRA